jgi:hypothetical protein
MISFFVNAAGSFGIRDYMANRGKDLAGHFNVVLYEELSNLTALPATGTIFAAVDQAGPAALCASGAIHNLLSGVRPELTLLNHPLQSLQRLALLRRLFDIGCNRFNAIRATADPSALRYPVFIRYEQRHNGSMSPLLHDRKALDRALVDLAVRGISTQELLIVEFCDTSGPDGLFRKYSAMRIGDTIIPRHVHAGTSWIAKAGSSADEEELVHEELEYLENHPHEKWLRHVFTEARIEYGRIDYGLYKGEPQVWEINTNPTLGRGAHRSAPRHPRFAALREPARAASHRLMLEAFKRLEQPETASQLPVVLPEGISIRLQAEARGQRQATAKQTFRQTLVQNAVSQSLKGVMRPLIAKFAPAVVRLVRSRQLKRVASVR